MIVYVHVYCLLIFLSSKLKCYLPLMRKINITISKEIKVKMIYHLTPARIVVINDYKFW